MDFNLILKQLRMEKGVSQLTIAEYLGVTKQAYSLYELGKRKPDNGMLYQISEYFNVSLDYLLGKTKIKNTDLLNGSISIPILGIVQAGIPIEATQEILGYEEITSRLASTGEFFGLQIKGNSMEPRFVEGDIVIVRKQPYAENGDIVVALINDDETTIKKIKITDQGIMLIPMNNNYEPIFFSRNEIKDKYVNIIGKVVELRAKF